MIRVFVADDHAVVREGLERIFDVVEDMVLAGATDNARDVVRQVPKADWDVLILDLSLPEGGGAEVVAQLRALRPSLPIVVYSMYPEEQYGARLLRAGASAYLSKHRSTDELLEAVRRASRGQRYVTDVVAEYLVESPAGDGEPHEGLSDREMQILLLLAEGKQTSAIATSLHISKSTVSTHIRHIKEKLSAESVTDLVRYAFRAGLVQ